MHKISVLLIDDHSLVRRGFRRMLEDADDIGVVGEAGDAEQALRIAQELRPEVIVMDCALPGVSGLIATRRILEGLPESKILMLSMHSEDTLVRQGGAPRAPRDFVKKAAQPSPWWCVRGAARGE